MIGKQKLQDEKNEKYIKEQVQKLKSACRMSQQQNSVG